VPLHAAPPRAGRSPARAGSVTICAHRHAGIQAGVRILENDLMRRRRRPNSCGPASECFRPGRSDAPAGGFDQSQRPSGRWWFCRSRTRHEPEAFTAAYRDDTPATALTQPWVWRGPGRPAEMFNQVGSPGAVPRQASGRLRCGIPAASIGPGWAAWTAKRPALSPRTARKRGGSVSANRHPGMIWVMAGTMPGSPGAAHRGLFRVLPGAAWIGNRPWVYG